MTPRPLTPEQTLAAERLGTGWTAKKVAEAADVSAKAVQRWQRREDFRQLVEQARRRVLEENPDAEATLRAALQATTRSGSPDWPTRVKAAALLMLNPSTDPEGAGEDGQRVTKIYVGDDADA